MASFVSLGLSFLWLRSPTPTPALLGLSTHWPFKETDVCPQIATRCRDWPSSRKKKKKKDSLELVPLRVSVGVILPLEASCHWMTCAVSLGEGGSCPRLCVHGFWSQAWVRAHSSAHTSNTLELARALVSVMSCAEHAQHSPRVEGELHEVSSHESFFWCLIP